MLFYLEFNYILCVFFGQNKQIWVAKKITCAYIWNHPDPTTILKSLIDKTFTFITAYYILILSKLFIKSILMHNNLWLTQMLWKTFHSKFSGKKPIPLQPLVYIDLSSPEIASIHLTCKGPLSPASLLSILVI